MVSRRSSVSCRQARHAPVNAPSRHEISTRRSLLMASRYSSVSRRQPRHALASLPSCHEISKRRCVPKARPTVRWNAQARSARAALR